VTDVSSPGAVRLRPEVAQLEPKAGHDVVGAALLEEINR
jgi:hypothetical protein